MEKTKKKYDDNTHWSFLVIWSINIKQKGRLEGRNWKYNALWLIVSLNKHSKIQIKTAWNNQTNRTVNRFIS